jgi:hypothetical protein
MSLRPTVSMQIQLPSPPPPPLPPPPITSPSRPPPRPPSPAPGILRRRMFGLSQGFDENSYFDDIDYKGQSLLFSLTPRGFLVREFGTFVLNSSICALLLLEGVLGARYTAADGCCLFFLSSSIASRVRISKNFKAQIPNMVMIKYMIYCASQLMLIVICSILRLSCQHLNCS